MSKLQEFRANNEEYARWCADSKAIIRLALAMIGMSPGNLDECLRVFDEAPDIKCQLAVLDSLAYGLGGQGRAVDRLTENMRLIMMEADEAV